MRFSCPGPPSLSSIPRRVDSLKRACSISGSIRGIRIIWKAGEALHPLTNKEFRHGEETS